MTSEVHEAEVKIQNQLGLHARPAAQLVRLSNRFGSDIFLSKNGIEVNGKSIMGVMMLAAERGARVQIRAVGTDARQAVCDLVALIERQFDEDDDGQPVDRGPSSSS
ncbi:MAG: HPr family phosphocarrier protein [Gemmatimonadota bacterium]